MRKLLVGIAVVLSLPAPSHAETCAAGQVVGPETSGHCCWPAQRWSEERCTGTPVCPAGTLLDGEIGVCVGQVLAPQDAPEVVPPPPTVPDAVRLVPVRFEPKRSNRVYNITVRPDDGGGGRDESHGLSLQRCTAPCTLNLPEGRVIVGVRRPNEEVETRITCPESIRGRYGEEGCRVYYAQAQHEILATDKKLYEQAILVPPRPSVATIGQESGLSVLFWVLSGAATFVVIYGIAITASEASCQYCNNGPLLAAGVASLVGGLALLGVNIGLIAGGAAGRNRVTLRDDNAQSRRRHLRLVGMGTGPAGSPGLSVGFSY